MTSDLPDNPLEVQSLPESLPHRTTFVERFNVSPVAIAFIVLAVVFVLYQVIGGTITFFLFGGKVRPETVQWLRFATMIGQLLLILIPTFVFTRLQSPDVKSTLRIRVIGSREIFLAIVGVLSLQQILQVYMDVQDLIPIPSSVRPFVDSIRRTIEEAYKGLVLAHSVPELIYVLLVVALVPAFCEEFLFRGLIQTNFEKGLKGWWGIIVPGLIFGAYHFNPFSFVPLAVLGIYFGFLVFRSNSIATSVAAHFGNNVFAVIAVFLKGDESLLFHNGSSLTSPSALVLNLGGFGLLFALSTYAFVNLTREKSNLLPQ